MKNILLSLIGLCLVIACSAKPGSVPNDPPRIEKPNLKALAFGVEYGVMKPEVVSVLVWPNNWSEQQTEDRVYTINKNSRYFDDLLLEKMLLAKRIGMAFADFQAQNCIAQFRKPAAEGADPLKDPKDYDETEDVDWVDSSAVPAGQTAAFTSCQANENERHAWHQRDDEIIHGTPEDLASLAQCPTEFGRAADVRVAAEGHRKSLPVVSHWIDCALGADNKISVSPQGTTVKVLPATDGAGRSVEITFKDFNDIGERVSQSALKPADLVKKADAVKAAAPAAEAALQKWSASQINEHLATDTDFQAQMADLLKYAKAIHGTSLDADGHRLQFTVPDMKSDLRLAKTEGGYELVYAKQYVFDLYRVANLGDSMTSVGDDGVTYKTDVAKFKGDLSVQVDGVEVNKGSGQLIGPFTGTAQP